MYSHVVTLANAGIASDGWNTLVAFFGRLTENWYRTGFSIAVAVVLFAMLQDNISKWLIPLTTAGGFWFTWQVFNTVVSGPDTPLFTGQTSTSDLWSLLWGSPLQFAAAAIGIAVGLVVFWKSKKNDDHEKVNIIVRVVAAIGAWAGVTLVFVLGMIVVAAFQ
jgi:hypothetical protein